MLKKELLLRVLSASIPERRGAAFVEVYGWVGADGDCGKQMSSLVRRMLAPKPKAKFLQ